MRIIAHGIGACIVEVSPDEHWVFDRELNTVYKGRPLPNIRSDKKRRWQFFGGGFFEDDILKDMKEAEVVVCSR